MEHINKISARRPEQQHRQSTARSTRIEINPRQTWLSRRVLDLGAHDRGTISFNSNGLPSIIGVAFDTVPEDARQIKVTKVAEILSRTIEYD